MRTILIVLALAVAFGCRDAGDQRPVAGSDASPSFDGPSFDGADYADSSAKVAHGQRLAALFTCTGCHGPDYAGLDFGEMFPIVEGLWATNISRTISAMSDEVLERILREGVHPARELYVMPSKQTQYLSDRDMAALLAFLRTIPPVGAPTPLPPPGFVEAVTARLPDDYWRTQMEGERRSYHSAAVEVAYFRANQPPDLGPALARGRMIASSLCSACHGAALDGVGEFAGDIQGALTYDDGAIDRLLTESIDRSGRRVVVEFGLGHDDHPLTAGERRDVVAYVRALARSRASRPQVYSPGA